MLRLPLLRCLAEAILSVASALLPKHTLHYEYYEYLTQPVTYLSVSNWPCDRLLQSCLYLHAYCFTAPSAQRLSSDCACCCWPLSFTYTRSLVGLFELSNLISWARFVYRTRSIPLISHSDCMTRWPCRHSSSMPLYGYSHSSAPSHGWVSFTASTLVALDISQPSRHAPRNVHRMGT